MIIKRFVQLLWNVKVHFNWSRNSEWNSEAGKPEIISWWKIAEMGKNPVSAKMCVYLLLLISTWKVSKKKTNDGEWFKESFWEIVGINFHLTKFKPEVPYYPVNPFFLFDVLWVWMKGRDCEYTGPHFASMLSNMTPSCIIRIQMNEVNINRNKKKNQSKDP